MKTKYKKHSKFKFRWETAPEHRCSGPTNIGSTPRGTLFGFCDICNQIIYRR
jgi:hypothetical protein